MQNIFRGRRWLATLSLTAALGATVLFGLESSSVPFGHNPPASIKTTTRSEAAAGRGYSSVVKKLLPAVVNISSSKVVKQDGGNTFGQDQGQGQGLDPFFRQFFGENGRGFAIPKDRREKALGS